MGFVNATYELGKMYIRKGDDSDFGDIDPFLQLPMLVIDDDSRSGRVIRVWLDVEDKNAETLVVRGISRIDLTDFIRDSDSEKLSEEKRKYLYREPTGSATPWKYSPIYKLGKGSASALNELIGEDMQWKENSKTRFYKLNRTVLKEFENCKVFSEGSTDIVMDRLEEHIGQLAEIWNDKNRSYIMVFGVADGTNFNYPGMIPAFRDYFKSKLSQNTGGDVPIVCSLCHCNAESGANLDKIFKFATFDKSNFLPGIAENKGVPEKVFPICEECLSYLSLGRNILDRSFLDTRTVPGVRIYAVPELIFGQEFLGKASLKTQDFIKTGLKTSERFFHILAKQENSLVYHFLFWEKNQAQERLHLMVEDVPPSRLKYIEQLWRETYKVFLWNEKQDPDLDFNTITLDIALKTLYSTLISLSGKNENDQKIVRDMVIGIIGRLLDSEKINVDRLKQFMVSRFPGLFADPDWIRFGGYNLRKMAAVSEFLQKANRR